MHGNICTLLVFILLSAGCNTLGQHAVYRDDLSLKEIRYAGGSLKLEYWVDGENRKQGIFREYYPTGVFKRCGAYKNDRLDGIIREFREDGTLESATEYHWGEKTGMHNIYYPNETVWSKEIYREGKIVGKTTFDEGGLVLSEETFNR